MENNNDSSVAQKPPRISNQQMRIAACYVLFQLLNLVNLLVAIMLGACLLAFVLALRGQTINNLLPWFLIIALPIWVGTSFWTYSLLIRHGVIKEKKVKPEASSAEALMEEKNPSAVSATPFVPANDEESLLPNVSPLRRLLSL